MTKISVAHALSVSRKKLKSEIKRVETIVVQFNSCRKELSTPEQRNKVMRAMTDRKQFVEMLVELEAKRAEANVPIVGLLKERDELVAEVEFLRNLPRRSGKEFVNSYDSDDEKLVEYEAVVDGVWIDERLAEITGKAAGGGKLGDLQAKINEFNATHFIEVSW